MSDQPWTPPGSGAPGSGPDRPFAAPGAPTPPPAAPGPPPPYASPPPGAPAPGSPPPGSFAAPPHGAPRPPYARMEFRPGIVPLRPLVIGDLFSGVLKAVRGNPGATIGLATLTSFVFLLPTTALGTWLASLSSLGPLDDSSSSAASETLPDDFGIGLFGTYLPSIGQVFSSILLAGFLAQVIGQAVLGRKVTMGETWRATRGRVLPMLGAVLVAILATLVLVAVTVGIPVGVIVYGESAGGGNVGVYVLVGLLGLLALVAGAVYLSTIWAFATPAIVIERVGVVAGLRRSAHLVGSPLRQPFWRILGLRVLTGIIVSTASSVITLPLIFILVGVITAIALQDPTSGGESLLIAQTVATGVVGLLTGALLTPFQAGVDALLYVDSRIRREGLDVELIQAAQGAAAPPWPLTSP